MSSEGPRVMIVDDEDLLRGALRRLLEKQGLTVCAEARDGEEAVATAAAMEPDVILMDFKMPRLNGLDAAKRIKMARPQVCVIMTTAYSDQVFRDEAESVGIAAYLLKGTRPAEIITVLLDVWRATAQRARSTASERSSTRGSEGGSS